MATKDDDTNGWPKKQYIYRSFEDDVPRWPFGPEKRRVLDAFNTNYGTKIFVENGILVEEKINSHHPSHLCPPCAHVGSHKGPHFCLPLLHVMCRGPFISYDAPEKTDSVVKPAKDFSQTIETAKPALVYYNRRHNTDYVLVDPINSNAFIETGKIWYHTSFTAKSETSAKASAVLFFAELKITGFGCGSPKYAIVTCRPLDEKSYKQKALDQCDICPKGLLPHPKSKFRQGCYKSNPRVLRPRSNGKVVKKRAVHSWGY